MRHYLRMLQKSIATRGTVGTAFYVFRWPLIIHQERKSLRRRHTIQSDFDKQRGTDTSGFIPISSFTIDSPAWVHGVRYAPTSPERFETSLLSLGFSRDQFKEYTFVDIGSGKGATLLYGLDIGFKAVYGVELVEELHRIAEKNLSLYGTAQRAKSICEDASTFKMPPPPLIVFANYPFSSKEMMASVVRNISAAGDGPKFLIANQFPYDLTSLPDAPLRLIDQRKDADGRTDYTLEVL